MATQNDLYLITTLTNMHVGSGDVNFGVIDNLIQRDTLNKHPNINSSSIKGAVREYYQYATGCKDTDATYIHIFGSKPREEEDLKQGGYRFFEANLLSIPVRSNKVPYVMATCPGIVKDVLRRARDFNAKLNPDLKSALEALVRFQPQTNSPMVFEQALNNAVMEEYDIVAQLNDNLDSKLLSPLKELLGGQFTLFDDMDFAHLCNDDNLPVISRNQLDKGQSQNLWYEQVLPRYSRLYFVIMKEGGRETMSAFETTLQADVVQIGANASIGYGYSKITKLSIN